MINQSQRCSSINAEHLCGSFVSHLNLNVWWYYWVVRFLWVLQNSRVHWILPPPSTRAVKHSPQPPTERRRHVLHSLTLKGKPGLGSQLQLLLWLQNQWVKLIMDCQGVITRGIPLVQNQDDQLMGVGMGGIPPGLDPLSGATSSIPGFRQVP